MKIGKETQMPSRIKGIHYQTEKPVCIDIRNGVIEKIEVLNVNETTENLPWIAPGLVDLQINGYCGMDFNSHPIENGMLQKVTRSLWEEGVTSYLPTVITNSNKAIEEAVKTIANSADQDELTNQSVAGIHLEGPFISPEDGPRGAHSQQYVQKPDWSLFQRWQEMARGKINIITLSPEWPGAIDFIEKCTESGVIVSIGHTAANAEQIREAVAAGARMSTHLGNGAHLMLPRHPNYLWEQLAQEDLWTCMIGDGFHLPDSVIKVILKVKGNKTMLVSDAVQLSGMPAGEYNLHIGGQVVLTQEGKLHLAENPNLLAGSAQLLLRGIENVTKMQVCSFSEVWDMASTRPKAFLNANSHHSFDVGMEADLVLFNWEGSSIKIQETFLKGVSVYKKS